MKKILFIEVGVGFKNPDSNLIPELKRHFPEYEIQVFDVLKIVKTKYWILPINIFWTFAENFVSLLILKKNLFKFRIHFLGTAYLFSVYSKLIRDHLRHSDYSFIIQTQCLCDSTNSRGIPFFIYTDHTNLNNLNYRHIKTSDYIQSQSYLKMELDAYKNAQLIFVMSDNIKESLINQYEIAEHKIIKVFVGANVNLSQVFNAKKYSNKNILFVGKDWKRKGGPLLVEAFKIVLEQIPDASLMIIGCTPKIKIKNCFEAGDLPLYQVTEMYNQASVFCLPTLQEPFGIVFIEAMLNRLPIITNSVGATPYLVKNDINGYLLDNDVNEFARVLIKLLQDPVKCREFGNMSYEIAAKDYTWENVANLMAKNIKANIG